MREPKFPSPVNSSGFIAATTIDPGRSIPASASASADASAMSAGKLSSRLPKRVIPAPAIHTSVTPSIKPEAGSVSTLSWRRHCRRLRVPRSPWRRSARRHVDGEFPHEAQQIRPLQPQRPRRPRAVAAELGQRRLDEPPLELGHRTVKPRRGPGTAGGLRATAADRGRCQPGPIARRTRRGPAGRTRGRDRGLGRAGRHAPAEQYRALADTAARGRRRAHRRPATLGRW